MSGESVEIAFQGGVKMIVYAEDNIEYISKHDLLTKGSAVIIGSKQLNEYDIELTVNGVQGAKLGDVVEDITMCPNLYFAGNTLNRIITRGLLITTRGKVLVENNRFMSTEMDGVLFSNDAKSWHESGRVLDATVRGNRFDYCGGYYVEILPENDSTGSIVHGDFVVEENAFNSPAGGGIAAKAATSLTVCNNTFQNSKTAFVKTKDVNAIISDV